MIPEEQKKLILRILSSKIPQFQCPMCQSKVFAILDGYMTNNLQEDYKNIVLPNKQIIPSVIIVCTNCGFMSQHSIGALGLLEEREK